MTENAKDNSDYPSLEEARRLQSAVWRIAGKSITETEATNVLVELRGLN